MRLQVKLSPNSSFGSGAGGVVPAAAPAVNSIVGVGFSPGLGSMSSSRSATRPSAPMNPTAKPVAEDKKDPFANLFA